MSRATPSLLLLLFLLVAGCRDGRHEAVQRADALCAEARWEDAAAAYSSLPPEAGRWQAFGAWRAAVIYRDILQDIPRAEQAFSECLRRWPDDDWGYACHVDRGDLLRDAGRPRDAIGAYRAALELRPRGSYAEHCLLESGRSYLLLAEPEQARVEWEELLGAFPSSPLLPVVALETARSYDLQGDHRGALTAYRAVQESYPEHSLAPVAAFGEGEALEQLGRLQDAATRFEELLGSHPNREAVQIKLDAVIVRLRRREQDGTQVMDRGMLLNPGSGGDAEKDPPKTQGAQTHEE